MSILAPLGIFALVVVVLTTAAVGMTILMLAVGICLLPLILGITALADRLQRRH